MLKTIATIRIPPKIFYITNIMFYNMHSEPRPQKPRSIKTTNYPYFVLFRTYLYIYVQNTCSSSQVFRFSVIFYRPPSAIAIKATNRNIWPSRPAHCSFCLFFFCVGHKFIATKIVHSRFCHQKVANQWFLNNNLP